MPADQDGEGPVAVGVVQAPVGDVAGAVGGGQPSAQVAGAVGEQAECFGQVGAGAYAGSGRVQFGEAHGEYVEPGSFAGEEFGGRGDEEAVDQVGGA
uniref:hypothetical protein n=1 Tax=Microbispora cellulosiformans TaxID=2614688 RepID=UPI0017829BE3